MTKVILKNPDKSGFDRSGLNAIDMHFHTEYSIDGFSKVDDVLRKCRKLDIGVAITDHDTIDGALRAFSLKKKEFVIPGIEITCHEGTHIILYFYDLGECKEFYNKEIHPQKKINPFFMQTRTFDMVDIASDYNCVICAPHPYCMGHMGIKKLDIPNRTIKKLNFIEGINGACIRSMNLNSIKWAESIGKPMTAGTDGHTTAELGFDLCFGHGENLEDFSRSIKKEGTIVGIEESLFKDVLLQIEKEAVYIERAIKKHEFLKLIQSVYGREFSTMKNKTKDPEFFYHLHSHHHTPHKDSRNHPHFKHLFSK